MPTTRIPGWKRTHVRPIVAGAPNHTPGRSGTIPSIDGLDWYLSHRSIHQVRRSLVNLGRILDFGSSSILKPDLLERGNPRALERGIPFWMTNAPPIVNGERPTPSADGESANVAAVSDFAKRVVANVEHAIVGNAKAVGPVSGGLAERRSHPVGGCSGRRQDDVGEGAGQKYRVPDSNVFNARPTCCPPTSPVHRSSTKKTQSSSFVPVRSLHRSCWPTKSIGRLRRTQASLLEAMAEGRVTVDGTTHELTPPFLVIATQNPVDHEGTFPLPEAQLDRFLMRFSLGYPTMDEEMRMLELLQHRTSGRTVWRPSHLPTNWFRVAGRSPQGAC